jgi:hypothetical protein
MKALYKGSWLGIPLYTFSPQGKCNTHLLMKELCIGWLKSHGNCNGVEDHVEKVKHLGHWNLIPWGHRFSMETTFH